MSTDLSRTFLDVLEELRPSLRRAAFARWVILAVGWILTVEPHHTLAAALVAAGVAGLCRFQPFYAFFERGAWEPDAIGEVLLRRVLRAHEGEPLRIVVDDTLCPHRGPHIFGLGCHLDPVLSTRRHKILRFGLNWVVLSVLVRVPFSPRWWALPILFRLYRAKKNCPADAYQKKTELARAMVERICATFPERMVVGTGDLGYCNQTVLRHRPANLVWVGTMSPKAALTALPTAPRRKKGDRVPSPRERAADGSRWKPVQAHLYGAERTVRIKTWVAQWYTVCGATPLRIVLVRTSGGAVPFRVFFSTIDVLDPVTVLECFAARWPIETFFEEARAWLGWGEAAPWIEAAVQRLTPFVGWLYTILVVWFAEGAWKSPVVCVPPRDWYPHKKGLSFGDIVRTARHVLGPLDVRAVVRSYDRLDRWVQRPPPPVQLELPLAA